MTLPPEIPMPGTGPGTPPIEQPAPVKEPEPDRLPDEEPVPNPDENPEPPKHVHATAYLQAPTWGILCHGVQVHSAD
jgi:hypothetical protein